MLGQAPQVEVHFAPGVNPFSHVPPELLEFLQARGWSAAFASADPQSATMYHLHHREAVTRNDFPESLWPLFDAAFPTHATFAGQARRGDCVLLRQPIAARERQLAEYEAQRQLREGNERFAPEAQREALAAQGVDVKHLGLVAPPNSATIQEQVRGGQELIDEVLAAKAARKGGR